MRLLYHPRRIVPVEPFCCIDAATSDSVTLSTSSEDTSVNSIIFSTDGTKLYTVGALNKNVYQYNLSVAWDLSTAVYSQLKYVGAVSTIPRGIYFNDDGTKMFIGGSSNGIIYSYTLSIAWDISTATYDNISFFSGLGVLSLQFSNNGLKMYKSNSISIVEYTLTIPYDISTAVYLTESDMGISFTIFGFWISNNGINLYLLHEAPGPIVTLYQYKLNTPWHINTAIQTCTSPATLNSNSRGLAFSPDGTKHYIANSATEITQYSSCPEEIESCIEYGLLYNWYAIKDVREVSSTGWHVPTKTDMDALVALLGGATGAGAKVKEIGTTYWGTDPGSTNSAKFNARGSGKRAYPSYSFANLRDISYLATQTDAASIAYYCAVLTSADNNLVVNSSSYEKEGHPIRLIKDATTLSDGQAGTYTGNDGKVYRTICIGTQEWLADNLTETRFRNGDIIPWHGGAPSNYFTDAEWAALTTAGVCAYDNDVNYVGCDFSFPVEPYTGAFLVAGTEYNNVRTFYTIDSSTFIRPNIGYATNMVRALRYANGLWLMGGYLPDSGWNDQDTMMYSYDGINWVGMGLGLLDYQVNDIVYSNGMWIVCGNKGSSTQTIAYSTVAQPTSWSDFTLATFTGFSGTYAGYGLSINNGIYLAFGDPGTHSIARSADGINWTGVTGSSSIFDYFGTDAAYNGVDTWAAAGADTYGLAYSVDNGISWTGTGTGIFGGVGSSAGYGVSYGNGVFVAVGGGGSAVNSIAYSSDGITWTGIGKTYLEIGYEIEFMDGYFYAGGTGVVGYSFCPLFKSSDGITWTPLLTDSPYPTPVSAIGIYYV